MLRVGVKKFLVIICFGVFLWFLLSIYEIPKNVTSKINNEKYIEAKLEKLQRELDHQLRDSKALLMQVNEHLRKEADYPNHIKDVDEKPGDTGEGPILPVLVISCDRITVRRCLDQLIKYRPNDKLFPIVVSQDCGHNDTYRVIKSYVDNDPSMSVVRQPDLSEIPLKKQEVKLRGYYKIARHYKFALNHIFRTLKYDYVIIVEDDLDVSPDFYEYFLGTYRLLESDPTLWCISAWNDNGKRDLIDLSRPELLYRTDFFPGLGWMMRRETWDTLEPIWPRAFFDDWLRDPKNTQGRACIRPEISRTYSFGKIGVSQGLFYDKHLRYMKLNEDFVEFTKLNLTYLIKDIYDANLAKIYSLPEMSAEEAKLVQDNHEGEAWVPYSDAASYRLAAKKLGAMDDFRSGIGRTAYRGIVSLYINNRRIYLAPSYEWTKYDPSWG